jgi:5-methylcytosine-specific restriction endonuclease McrA
MPYKDAQVRSEYHKRYSKEHREQMNAANRRYYQTHREERLAYGRQYDKEHPEKVYAKSRKYRKAHPEKVRAFQRKWNDAHLDKRRIYEHNRRARIKGNGGNLPLDIEDILFELQEGVCYLCGDLLYGRLDDPPTIEHKIPISRGGSNDISNVGLAHLSCNNKKYTMTYDEFMEVLK